MGAVQINGFSSHPAPLKRARIKIPKPHEVPKLPTVIVGKNFTAEKSPRNLEQNPLAVRPGAPSSFFFLVVRPGAPSSVVRPGAPSSVLAPTMTRVKNWNRTP